ncbi:MAG: hypothetical protein KatS3mg095_0270 [Candidatus Parcubacteria bacterium]|nr:MAG: hypothetical protein KatS3mg095_0270 [Candidatus Parcubacteria bacterium]
MKKIFLFFLISSIILVNFSWAEVYKFFEFAPDFGNRIEINANEEYVQKFIPFNDFLSMIRIWIENIGSSTNLSFTLLDNENNILENKNIIIPSTNFSWSGFYYDIPLSNNIRINSGNEYKFKLTTEQNNNIKIFAFNLLELLQNIEFNLNLPETIKPLIINNSETEYSFKIALYEGTENLPPIISNLTSQIINQNSAQINFNANEPIRYEIIYYDNISYNTTTYQTEYFEVCPVDIRVCSTEINIQPEREYFVKLIAYDYWHNSSTAETNFNTYTNTSTDNYLIETPNQSNSNRENYSDNKNYQKNESFNQSSNNYINSKNKEEVKDNKKEKNLSNNITITNESDNNLNRNKKVIEKNNLNIPNNNKKETYKKDNIQTNYNQQKNIIAPDINNELPRTNKKNNYFKIILFVVGVLIIISSLISLKLITKK